MRYEAGTPNIPGLAALNAGVQFIQQVGRAQMAAKERADMDYLLERLQPLDGLELYGDLAAPERCPILSFNLQGMAALELAYILEQSFGLGIRAGLHCAPLIHRVLGTAERGSVRVSLSYFTQRSELDHLVAALFQIAEMCL